MVYIIVINFATKRPIPINVNENSTIVINVLLIKLNEYFYSINITKIQYLCCFIYILFIAVS